MNCQLLRRKKFGKEKAAVVAAHQRDQMQSEGRIAQAAPLTRTGPFAFARAEGLPLGSCFATCRPKQARPSGPVKRASLNSLLPIPRSSPSHHDLGRAGYHGRIWLDAPPTRSFVALSPRRDRRKPTFFTAWTSCLHIRDVARSQMFAKS